MQAREGIGRIASFHCVSISSRRCAPGSDSVDRLGRDRASQEASATDSEMQKQLAVLVRLFSRTGAFGVMR